MRVTHSLSPPVRYAIVALIGIVLAVVVMQLLSQQARTTAIARIERRTEQVTVSVQQSVESTLHVLESFQALYAVTPQINRDMFRTFAEQMLITHPEIRTVEWVPYIPAERRADFEAATQAEFGPDFEIFERAADGSIVRAADRAAYYPVLYLAPTTEENPAIGFDLGANAARLQLLESTARSGSITASPPTRVGQEDQHNIYIYQPIYARSSPDDEPARLDAVSGYVVLVLNTTDFLSRSLERVRTPGIEVAITDAEVPDITLFETLAADERASGFAAHSSEKSVSIAGRSWILAFAVSDGSMLEEAQNTGAWGFVIILGITGMLIMYLRQRTQAELAMHEYARSLEATNRELLEFNHTIAHDLKSPLAIILGYADLLQDEDLTPNGRRMLSMIPKMVDALLEMIEDLLKLATLRDAQAKVETVDTQAVIERTLERFGDSRDSIVIEGTLPAVMGHPQWLTEIFANLISNALKYRDDQRVLEIRIRAKPLGERVRYEVQDNGLGIAPEDQERIFKLFSRLNTNHERGLGIGLSIVQRMVTKLGGELGVESELGKGSTFWFTLPKG